MDMKEKLVELLEVDLSGSDGYEKELIADYLIAHGVTVNNRGHWEKGRYCLECSACHNGYVGMMPTNYCPDCGAKMDGGNDNGC